jgi:hypothetical protein
MPDHSGDGGEQQNPDSRANQNAVPPHRPSPKISSTAETSV